MKTPRFIPFWGIFLLVLLCSFMPKSKKTVWMIGDSTMAIKAPDKFPETGWGVAFAEMFRPDVDVLNKAKNGRSTKSCIREGIWKEVSDGLRGGDYVFIQFGHNDEKVHKPNTGTTIEEYKANLSLFVTEARSKGAEPILLTPIARRAFEDGKLVDTHGAYPDAVRKVADSLHVPLIDLTQQTSELLTELGEEKSASLFLHLPEGHINYPKGVIDNTHLNERGAEAVAHLVALDLEQQHIPLAKDLKE
ncbi:rhamnogalacturonan acetylesterase [Sphingobacterium haloxyli]|uniref:GntR family transcriptional regulator n=1 Tax=Sphingobacterium haloxyli TaxID=2100533 RepID=A0A2S9J148_9SPHI|nr:rhamnogalacturonan acetylesterase [Sphingobacterium haloxyli]PRD46501.1 GntR family transcriptional regulator [Sphingobacterium haloxyli]